MNGPSLAAPHPTAWVEWSYRISLTAKGLLGLTQLLGGLALLFSPNGAAQKAVVWMARYELAEDPDDPLARAVADWAGKLTQATENFYTIYLLGHGALNLGVVLALLLRVRGAYHASLAVLIAFVGYQLVLFTRSPDPMILVLTAIDIAIIALVITERHQRARPGP